jgi:hypothetical protein
MKTQSKLAAGVAALSMLAGGSSLLAQEKKAEKAEKAKAQKVAGDVGLLDTDKKYMIVVTKEGKLVTIDYNDKTKVTALKPGPAKIADIGLGSAASVQYVEKNGKNYLTSIEYKVKKGE